MKAKILILLVVLMSVLVACSSAAETTQEEASPIVFVSIVPQQYFINRIAGDLVDARVMVEPGADPHTYEPKPSQMAALSEALAYFATGIEFEDAWLAKFADANPDMVIIDTTEGIERLPMLFEHSHDDDHHEEGEHHDHDNDHHEEGEHHDHDDDHHEEGEHYDHDDDHHEEGEHHDHDDDHHEEGEHHDHDDDHHDEGEHHHNAGELDPHVWVSPALVKIQVQHMYDTLVELLPDHETEFSENLATFLVEIDALEADIEQALAGVTSRKFIVFHPSWGYFAAQFNLEMIAIEVGGTEPSAAELAAIIDEAREEDIHVIFAQPEFSTKSAETIAREINGEVILISPLAYNWLENLQQVAQTMAEVLSK